jgi:hypothetical protein
MTIVQRYVRKVPDLDNPEGETRIEAPENYRAQPAWVLLAEPGMGKSELFKSEADYTGGKYLPITEFIYSDPEDTWGKTTLFLDGLDEVRASGGGDGNILHQIKRQLRRIGNPPFRIACRAADWYGSTDIADIEAASPDSKVVVLLLEPLSHEDTLTILVNNHGVSDATGFIAEAEKRGVADLIDNPQVLGLLVKAIRDGRWPADRNDTYQMACEKLVAESNKRHRNLSRSKSYTNEQLLDAAGQLCAVLMLSDKTGIALDVESADEQFPNLIDCIPPDVDAAIKAVKSNLFRRHGEERLVPGHRSVAEYLASRWIARQVDKKYLPAGRVLNLLLGSDSRAVAGLRGIYGWLALHCRALRSRLINSDPLTVIIYGDVKAIPTAEKRTVLEALRSEAEQFAGFRWDNHTEHRFGALADLELREDFLSALTTKLRDDASQAFAGCVLDVLKHSDIAFNFSSALLSIVVDDTWRAHIRKNALKNWLVSLEKKDLKAASSLLDEIDAGRVQDNDDELMGILLSHLYPKYLDPKNLLRYIHSPKAPNLLGSYGYFWEYQLPELAYAEHLPILLSELVVHTELSAGDPYERRLRRMVDRLLARGIDLYGDHTEDEELFEWLGIGIDQYGHVTRNEDVQQAIASWLGERPQRNKGLLSLCFSRCQSNEHVNYCVGIQKRRLHHAVPPSDIGLWHFEQISLAANDALAELHLIEAVNALAEGNEASGLSLELIEGWRVANPGRTQWVDRLLTWEIPSWRIEGNSDKRLRDAERTQSKRKNAVQLSEYLPAIAAGKAHPNIMGTLAGVWANRFIDTPGETPEERFNNYSENGYEAMTAAESGFRYCPERDDLPTVKEIIDLSIKQREHYIRLPCLLGMDLRWRNSAAEIESLDDDILRKMIAFRLTYGVESAPEWFVYLVQRRPQLVADVLIPYASSTLKAGQSFVDSIYPLENDPDYKSVAIIVVPRLLEIFPVRARKQQLFPLDHLLKAAIRYVPKEIFPTVKKKVAAKSMDVAQKIYWLAAATLLDAENSELALWRYVGKSQVRADHLSSFFSGGRASIGDYELSPQMIGKFIEIAAPHAQLDWPDRGGLVTGAMRQGDQVRALITSLSMMTTPAAAQELDRLLGIPVLHKLKFSLERARHELTVRLREERFKFLTPGEVVKVLSNKEPANNADLAALVLDTLDDIAEDIRRENDDGFRAFWNVENKKNTSRREENLCRDVLLERLRSRLSPTGIDCQPEGDFFNDKRSDLKISYGTQFALPIEIKRDSDRLLWQALQEQLINQYAIAPLASGFGIYLVFWFGGEGMPRAIDGERKPRSPEELQRRLEAQIAPIDRLRIFVRVLDVSWPA